MRIIKGIAIVTLKIVQKTVWRIMPLFFLSTLLLYLVYSVQENVLPEVRKEHSVTHTTVITTLSTSQIPSTTENVTLTSALTTETTTVASIVNFPMDIDLKKHVRDKIEKNIDIPAKPINQHKYKYIHQPPKCQFTNTSDNVTLLILVKSGVRNVFLRNAIRDTWGEQLGGDIILRFMIGYSISHIETTKKEAETYNDIIVENFVDSYPNNTLKTIMGFNWAVAACETAKVIMFLDDDHLPHISNIMTYLRSLNQTELDSLLCGYRINKGKIYKGKHHWAIPKSDYPYKTWPPYLRGGTYLVSQKIALRFSIAFPFVKYLHVDDGYLGVVALKLGIEPQHDGRFLTKKQDMEKEKNHFVFNDYKHPHNLKMGWKLINKTL